MSDIPADKVYRLGLTVQVGYHSFSGHTTQDVADLVVALAGRNPFWTLIPRRHTNEAERDQVELQLIRNISSTTWGVHLESAFEAEHRLIYEFCRGFLAARERPREKCFTQR